MGHDLFVALVGSVMTAVFGAGMAWDQFRRMRKDLNGLGTKLGRVMSALLVSCPEADRKEMAKMLGVIP